MKTDIKSLANHYKAEAWTGDLAWLNEKMDIHVKASNVTDQSSHASITIEMNPKGQEDKEISATICIIESTIQVKNPRPGQDAEKTRQTVVFLNNHSHSIIFSSMSGNALEKSEKYITQYFAKRAAYMTPEETKEAE